MKSHLPLALVAFALPTPALAAEDGPPDATMIPVEIDDTEDETVPDDLEPGDEMEEISRRERRRRRRRHARRERADAKPDDDRRRTRRRRRAHEDGHENREHRGRRRRVRHRDRAPEPQTADDDADRELTPSEPNWGLAMTMGLLGLGGGGLSPVVAGTFERRLGDGVYLVGVVHASGSAASEQGEYDNRRYEGSVAGDLGLRGVLYDGPVEASLQGAARGYYGDSQSTYDRHRGWNVSLVGGLVLQHHFTDWFALRVATDLVAVGYGETSNQSANHEGRHARWSASFSPNPQLGARIAF